MMIEQGTKRIAHLLVTCCVEETRFEVLKQVVENLKLEQEKKHVNISKNLWVFENGSTVPGSREFIRSNFSNVFESDKNYGFWSAINWFLKYINDFHSGEFDYIHIIESDHIFFAIEKLLTCEAALDKYKEIGSIRCQEFVVSEAHLYDKDRQSSESRSYAWVRQRDWNGKQITFNLVDSKMNLYSSGLVPLLHSVNRLDGMFHAFNQLQACESFSEQDFQKFYKEIHPESGLIDGGLFHTKLTWDSPNLSASWSPKSRRDAVGYRDSRHDSIVPISQMKVVKL